MKKQIILITSLLAMSSACFAGCNNTKPDGEQNPEKKEYEIVYEHECPDGKCGKDGKKCPDCDPDRDEKVAPDFIFRPRKIKDANDSNRPDAPEKVESDDNQEQPSKPHPEHRRPRRKDRSPEPRPMPLKPEKSGFANI